MFTTKQKINFYETKIDLRKVIAEQNVKDSDDTVYVCDLSKLKEKYELWHKHLPRVKPYYAVKCNDDPHVLKRLADYGANFDCASKREIEQIMNIGVEPNRILFAHTCKMVSHIKYARQRGVMTSTVDTECELYKLQQHFPESNAVIRIRCDAKDAYLCLGAKYGCDAETEAPALMLLAKKLNLKVTGISFHVGSHCKEFAAFDRAISKAKRLFKYGAELGFDMHVLDIGGGFSGTEYEFKALAEVINKSLLLHFGDDNVNIIAEPGRFFVSEAYTLISKVLSKREPPVVNGDKPTKHYYLNDGIYGSFVHVVIAPGSSEVKHFVDDDNLPKPKFNTILWGPTCDSLDKIAENLMLPDMQCDDIVIFTNMGAYTLPVACNFNGLMSRKIIYYEKAVNKRESVYG
uniref:ornithine decarboxylase n=1 Tax=Stomoxys calcitrans TaxID=35570 RepID=A0A1I8PJX6_STOCA